MDHNETTTVEITVEQNTDEVVLVLLHLHALHDLISDTLKSHFTMACA